MGRVKRSDILGDNGATRNILLLSTTCVCKFSNGYKNILLSQLSHQLKLGYMSKVRFVRIGGYTE